MKKIKIWSKIEKKFKLSIFRVVVPFKKEIVLKIVPFVINLSLKSQLKILKVMIYIMTYIMTYITWNISWQPCCMLVLSIRGRSRQDLCVWDGPPEILTVRNKCPTRDCFTATIELTSTGYSPSGAVLWRLFSSAQHEKNLHRTATQGEYRTYTLASIYPLKACSLKTYFRHVFKSHWLPTNVVLQWCVCREKFLQSAFYGRVSMGYNVLQVSWNSE